MNKQELIDHVSKQASISKADSERAVNAVFQGISETLGRGKDARFVGFGTFNVAQRNARNGRNPRTGETIRIPASRVARFRPGKELKDSLN
jgi:DNA-binding protein HU-beta